MLYWPLAGRVIRVKLALADVVMLVKVVPSGFLRTKAADPIVFCEIGRASCRERV